MNSSSACAVPSAIRRSRLASTSAGVSPGSFQMKNTRRSRAWVFSILFSRFSDGSGSGGMGRLLPSTFSSCVGIGRHAGGRGAAFELGEALLETLRRQRPHVDVDHLGYVGGLRRRELASRSRSPDRRRRLDAVRARAERPRGELARLALSRRRQPLHANADGGDIAVFGHVDCFARDRLGAVRQQALHEDRRPVARPAPPGRGISAFALLKLHDLSPFLQRKKYAARGRSASAQQKARRGVPPGRLGVVLVNTLFWKILVTRVKRKMRDASGGRSDSALSPRGRGHNGGGTSRSG